jgi:hypothetical protein
VGEVVALQGDDLLSAAQADQPGDGIVLMELA